MAAENVYNLDDTHTYKSLNEKPGAYEGSPGAAVLNLSNKNKPEAVEVHGDKGEDISIMSEASRAYGLSKWDLLELMRKATISVEDL